MTRQDKTARGRIQDEVRTKKEKMKHEETKTRDWWVFDWNDSFFASLETPGPHLQNKKVKEASRN